MLGLRGEKFFLPFNYYSLVKLIKFAYKKKNLVIIIFYDISFTIKYKNKCISKGLLRLRPQDDHIFSKRVVRKKLSSTLCLEL